MKINKSDVLVIGSGPGGSLSSALLAEYGLNVALIEAGGAYPLSSSPPFSFQEIHTKYRSSGISLAFGNPNINYAEGFCVGGGSEVNSGLYHRLPVSILNSWSNNFSISNLTSDELIPFYEINEHELSVNLCPADLLPRSSLMLKKGADALGWENAEIKRWYKYPDDGPIKQSMTETYIPRALSAGATLFPNTNATLIYKDGKNWAVNAVSNGREISRFIAKSVFICGGAIHSAFLLKSSNLSKLAGSNLNLHPTIKVVAHFNEEINDLTASVAPHQVKEFSPHFSFGCSISTPTHLKMAMFDVPNGLDIVDKHAAYLSTYYCMVTNGSGSVKKILNKDPLVTFDLGKEGYENIINGMKKLCECLFAAGAHTIYPSTRNSIVLNNMADVEAFCTNISLSHLNLMTIHLFSSCPLGEDLNRCVVNSYGRLHGHEGLYVNDSSLLPTAPSVNPQGITMAIARRNIINFLGNYFDA